nr:MAG TPA: Receptor Binding Protein [Caudoviricetes sp.]
MKWLHGRTSGVFGADGNLSVTSNGNMTVNVADGVGWLANADADGTVFWNDTKEQTGSELKLTVPLANAVYPRIDRVVVTWATVDYSVKPSIEILSGTAASNPTAPALTNNTLKRQISLAQIYVGAAVSKITAANITDERLDSTVCGLVTDWVSVDTKVMQEQFAAFLTQIKTELEQLHAGTATMLRSTYDPQGRHTDIFKAIDKVANIYYARLTLNGWTACSSADQAKGLLYQQTATLTCANSHAPVVTAASEFLSGIGYDKTGVPATDDVLNKVQDIINDGVTVTAYNSVLVKVKEKPTAEIRARWVIQS